MSQYYNKVNIILLATVLGAATGAEILHFINKMHEDILSHFDIDLEPEVNII